jgi:hypothetical protein
MSSMTAHKGPGSEQVTEDGCLTVISGTIKVTRSRDATTVIVTAGEKIDVKTGDKIRWQHPCDYHY